MSEEILDLIKKRKSVRKYEEKEVEDEKIEKLLEAAILAPSAGNRQPWKFIVIKDEDIISKVTSDPVSRFNQGWMDNGVPLMIAVCADPKVSAKKYGDRGRTLYAIQDTAAAIQNIMLTAAGLGLGTCWIGAFDEVEVSNMLELEPGLRIYGMITVGYPAKESKRPSRKPLSDVVRYID
ncbi:MULTISPECIES: nitroreductase family protein [unclassified Candidatus Frackibacter]|uniref:nitroreductase family protein n=1 Tax=unclassified Candidatus Frackibacter TaxID=2648818 RepID=UPI0007910EE6|nr:MULTISPECIES: nitroreductase family protein [unclassified Candidatus Frackibacter]KXS40184.1 MAG: NADH dehydrogenase/NAD(P)H nitroreductase [Candidatus Frackibacter sp. T328-2]SDC33565.1 Nitroreductase [Candidatus Frackibacter sp. WG11]SEM57580.1 Nitroreductase [Candidatus Frackibacter sp. WG12]SFM09305.1 Nitroreductase [Candidatus Frackibacter sp. WG13]